MPDQVSKARRSEIMRGIRRENTRPEILVRRRLHRLGYRFRLHRKDLPGSPDIVLPKYRLVVFVHGCFWHGCESCYRGARVPQNNRDYWLAKVRRNRLRDLRSAEQLEAGGWKVVVVWECETNDLDRLGERVVVALQGRSRREGDSS